MRSMLVKMGRALAALWLLIGFCIVFLIVAEVLIRVALYATTPKTIDSRVMADGYHNAAWVQEFFADLSGAWVRWLPFAYWIGTPYRSHYLNISADGLRETPDQGASPAAGRKTIRIFMFGGSTMWGEGARDAYTIPSWLQRMLDAIPYAARVSNYGQDGYVSSQEMILLFEQLQRGNVPDLVIFYDGFNDSTSAMINGAAGETFGEANRRNEFNAFNQWSKNDLVLYERAASAFAVNSGLGRLAKKIVRVLEPGKFKERNNALMATQSVAQAAQAYKLQEQVVATYLANKRLIEAGAAKFRFRTLFFWQPTVWTKTKLTKYEAEQTWLPGEKEFMDGVYRRIAAIAAQEDIHDLSAVFGDSAKPYYIDDAHITEEGNRIVAQAMLPYVLHSLKQAVPATQSRASSLPPP